MAFSWQIEYHRYREYFANLGRFYQQKKARTYAGIIFSILTVAFFLLFAIKPTVTTIAALLKQIKDQKLVAEKLQIKINALQEAQNEYLVVESNLHLVDEALPIDPSVSALAKQIEALSRNSSVSLKTIRYNQAPLMGEEDSGVGVQKEKKPNQAISVSFNLAVSGDYLSLKNFLQSLSSLRRTILVQSLSFKTGKTEDQALVLNLNAQAHYLKPSEK